MTQPIDMNDPAKVFLQWRKTKKRLDRHLSRGGKVIKASAEFKANEQKYRQQAEEVENLKASANSFKRIDFLEAKKNKIIAKANHTEWRWRQLETNFYGHRDYLFNRLEEYRTTLQGTKYADLLPAND